MKKNVFYLLVLLVAMMSTANAQNQPIFAWGTTSSAARDAIIRSYDATTAVSCNTWADTSWFYEVQMTSSIFRRVPVPKGVIVKDFRIVGNYVVFCGTDNSSGRIGYFDINELQNSSVQFNFCKIDSLATLLRLGVYEGGGQVSVVAIGAETNVTVPQVKYCVTIPNIVYPTAHMYTTANCQLTDVAVTDNNVILSGLWGNHVRLWQLSKISMTNGQLMRGYSYSVLQEPYSNVHICSLYGDYVFLSYLAGDPDNFEIRMRLIESNSMTMKNSQTVYVEKSEPNEMVFMPYDKTVVIAHGLDLIDNNTNSSSFMYIEPFNTAGYIASALRKKSFFGTAIDVNEDKRYLSASGSQWLLDDKSLLMPSNCADSAIITVKPIENVVIQFDSISSSTSFFAVPYQESSSVETIDITETCFDY